MAENKGIDWSWLIALSIAALGALILALTWNIAMFGALIGYALVAVYEIRRGI